MEASLCTSCSSLPAKLFQPGAYTHEISFPGGTLASVAATASQGCKLCILLIDAMEGESCSPGTLLNGRTTKLQALCKRRKDSEYHFLDTELDHTKVIGVWIGNNKVCHLRFELGEASNSETTGAVRQLQKTADDPSNFALISTWLDVCTKQHDDCTMNLVSDLTLPARLIDVRPEEPGVDVKLVVTANQNQQLRTGYAVLSHCWGPNAGGMLKATTGNLEQLQRSINWDSLSKTFQDAINITRKLTIRGKGIRYLWIDSLCILQDDPKDFEREGTAMHKTYSMATCTIAASSSSDGQGGCLIPRGDGRPEPLKPCQLSTSGQKVTIHPWSEEWSNFHRGSLSTRGWCFQERELSRRILHFTKHRIFWECRTAIASEDHPSMINLQYLHASQRPHGTDPDRLLVLMELGVRSFMPLANTRPLATKLWCRAVQEYTRRNLTYRKDRLPALYGIAKIIGAVIRDDYVAGIWLCDFARGASWLRDMSIPNPNAVAGGQWPVARADPLLPTWSWAAIDGPVLYPGLETFDSGGYSDGDGAPANLHQLGGAAFSYEEYDRNGSRVHQTELANLSAKYQKGLLSNYTLEVLGLEGQGGNFGAIQNSELAVRGVAIDIVISESDCFPPSSTMSTSSPGSASKCYAMFGRSIFRVGSSSKPNVVKGVVHFDDDPRQLMKQPFVCLRLGERKMDMVQGEKVYFGLVLQSVLRVDGFGQGQYFRRVGTWEVGNRNKSYNKHVRLGEFVLV
ncbi:heterokaryon incompatibility protein-domain-containing protein [Rhexocercosporidium sp. MPI-PUGE-AT-0058]|nr:heterokaryon incompatibility protein-domain-containing protein [Rhexocercosporidium sp. MPI-PUGE-AT-0058]